MRAWRSLCLVVLALMGVVALGLSTTLTAMVPVLTATALIMGGRGT